MRGGSQAGSGLLRFGRGEEFVGVESRGEESLGSLKELE